MAKFYFKYGVMNSSKTANLLMVAYNYESQGRHIVCLKSALDTRWSSEEGKREGLIESRALPNSHTCIMVSTIENLYNLIKQYNNESIAKYSSELSAVLIDEAQFLSKDQVKQLSLVVEKLHIDVICFGLKNTFIDGELFEGASVLLYYADSINEIKTICKYCNRKATMNLRIVNGRAIYNGEPISVGDVGEGSDCYAQVCYHHYLNPPAPIMGANAKVLTKQNYIDKFNYILKNQNPYGYYRRTSEVSKLGLEYSFAPTLNTKEDSQRIKYLIFGPICIDLVQYNKSRMVNKKVKTAIGSLNITDAIINFIYHFFEQDTQTAFKLLQSSSCNYIKFYETKEDLENSFKDTCKEETKKRGTLVLPDGKFAYVDHRVKTSWDFYQSILTGFSLQLNNIEVGFYVDTGDTQG